MGSLLGVVLASSALVANAQRKPRAAPPEITAGADPSFQDLGFHIERRDKRDGDAQALRLTGRYRGRDVGFELVLAGAWKPGSRPDNQRSSQVPAGAFEGEVRIVSVGAASDSLLVALDERYGTRLKPAKMAPEVRFNCLSLGGDPRLLDMGPVHLKLFYLAGDQGDSAELLLEIDAKAQRVVLREKDEAFRGAVVRALTQRTVR